MHGQPIEDEGLDSRTCPCVVGLVCCGQHQCRVRSHIPTTHAAQLHFHKNKEGQYHDPVTFKVFGPHTHIAVIKTSGNAYGMDTIKRLNYDVGNFKVHKLWSWPSHVGYSSPLGFLLITRLQDLMTNEAFTRKDVVVIQDPQNPALRHYTLLPGAEAAAAGKTSTPGIRSTNSITARVMQEVERKSAEQAESERVAAKRKRDEDAAQAEKEKSDPVAAAAAAKKAARLYLAAEARKTSNFTAGQYSRSFTSSSVTLVGASSCPLLFCYCTCSLCLRCCQWCRRRSARPWP